MDKKESENAAGAIRRNVERVVSGTTLGAPPIRWDPLYTYILSGLPLVAVREAITRGQNSLP